MNKLICLLMLLILLSCSSKKEGNFKDHVLPLIRQSLLNETIKFQVAFVEHKLTYKEYENYYLKACEVFNGMNGIEPGSQNYITNEECVNFMHIQDPKIEQLKNK